MASVAAHPALHRCARAQASPKPLVLRPARWPERHPKGRCWTSVRSCPALQRRVRPMSI